MNTSGFFHFHAHSEFSVLDGMGSVEELVERAARNKQPGLALTDHGVMSGAVKLYRECKSRDLIPFPGEEFYVVRDVADKTAPRRHLTMVALTGRGYEGMVKLSSLSQQRDHFYYRPRVDYQDLASFSEDYGADVAIGTGCFFGVLVQALVNESERAAKQILQTLKGWFPNTYVELQRHGIKMDDHDDIEISDLLTDIALNTGIMPIITYDSHYPKSRQSGLHDFYKDIAYIGTEDNEFPGDTYHLASSDWVAEYWDDPKGRVAWNGSLAVMRRLLSINSLSIDPLDTYHFNVPRYNKKKKAIDELRANCELAAENFPQMLVGHNEYWDRLEAELKIIDAQGFADYFLLVHDVVKWCQKRGILVQARGSASGSLVCYLLGITQIDPLKWELLFERFLSVDRTKPPDIDLDIEDSRREEVIEYIKKRFDVLQIGTFPRLSINDARTGSLWVQYMAAKRARHPNDFYKLYGSMKTIDDLDEEDRERLLELDAVSIRRSMGAHAAGFIVAGPSQPVSQYIPTMLIASSGHSVSQYLMEDVEELGYVKLDLLGVRALSTVKRTLELIDEEGLDWIPDNDRKTLGQLRSGRTVGVFQLEGWTATQGCQELGVRSTEDVINVMALYRPATIASGYKDLFVQRRGQRKGRQRGSQPSGQIVSYPHPIFKKHLAGTHGVAVFQEQIMLILRDLGVPIEKLNAFLKALKSSNDKAWIAHQTFQRYRLEYLDLAMDQGMPLQDAKESWDLISGFAGYGFNRAHGVAYGLLAYRTAYLKTHYPLEYMSALLEMAVGSGKESSYVAEARRLGIRVLSPDVNLSGISWGKDPDDRGIRKGLMAIKGVGIGAAETIVNERNAHGEFASIEDLIERVPARKVTGGREWNKDGTLRGTLEKLRNAGGLRTLGVQP